MWKWLKGKKSYVVALGALVSAAGAYLSGELTLAEFILLALGGTGIATVRHGVANEIKKLKDE